MTNRFRSIAVALLILSMLLAACSSPKTETPAAGNGGEAKQEAPKKVSPAQISLGAGSQGGVYYPIGVGVATIVSKHVSGTKVTPEVTGAATENAVLLGNGEVAIGITTAGDLYKAAKGEAPFDKKYGNISVMFGGVKPGAVQIVVKKDSAIKSITDLKGKKVAVGPQGGSGWTAFAEMLTIYGLKFSDIQASYISYDESIDALKDGNIDASVIAAGTPTPAVTSLAVQAPYRMLGMTKEEQDKFMKQFPYYTPITIKADAYKDLGGDILTFGTVNVVAVRDDLADDLVYKMTQSVFDHLDELYTVHASAKAITVDSAAGFKGFRYHPGSAKFFTEKGKEVPTK